MLLAFNKPWGVLCQFSGGDGRPTLADYIRVPGVYPAGRLDRDSEGLLVLTDDGRLQASLSHPRHGKRKVYVVQLEGEPGDPALQRLLSGVLLNDGPARALAARWLDGPPDWIWPREPPVRYRRSVPDGWAEITLGDGRNRQLRRMTAAVGLPTLRLIRTAVGPYRLDGLSPGQWRELAQPRHESARTA